MEQGKFTLPRSILFSLAFKLCQMLRPDLNTLKVGETPVFQIKNIF